jgi:mannosyltransferase
VRTVAESIGPSLQPGDLVVATQPEQVSVLEYYLPDGLRYATLTGPVKDVGVTDWRDGVERLRASSARRDLEPLIAGLEPGRRLVLVEPQTRIVSHWSAPWTRLIRLRSREWNEFVTSDPRVQVSAIYPARTFPERRHPLRATVLLRTPGA